MQQFEIWLVLFPEAVLQRHSPVEDQVTGGRVPVVQAEVALPHELEALGIFAALRHGDLGQALFHLAALEDLETVGVQAVQEVLVRPVRLRIGEEIIIEPHLRVGAVVGVHPVDGGALDLAAVGGIAAAALGIVLAENLGDLAGLVLHAAGAGDQIRALEADLKAGMQPLVLGGGDLHKVVFLDPEIPGEGDLAAAVLGLEGIVLHSQQLALPLRVVGDGELHRVQHRHDTAGVLVQIVPQAALQKGPVHRGVHLADADALAEIADGAGGVAPPPQAAESGHPGIVPAGDPSVLHQLAELPLGHDGVVDTQTGKLDLPGFVTGDGDVGDHPVVQRPVILILQGAERVSDALQRVLDGMGEVVHGEDAPFGALAVMLDIADAVEHRVSHVEVAAGQVDLGPEGVAPLLKFARAHPTEEIQTLLDGTVAPGADSGTGGVAPVFLELLRGQLAHVGQPLLDQLNGVFIGLLKVVRAVEQPVAPVEAKPVDILLDGIDVLSVLLGGVGIVKAQVTDAAKMLCRAEVDGQRLAVADMQIAVGLGRETGVHLHAVAGTALGKILLHKGFNEISCVLFHGNPLHPIKILLHYKRFPP